MSYDAIHAFISYLFYTGTDTAWYVPSSPAQFMAHIYTGSFR